MNPVKNKTKKTQKTSLTPKPQESYIKSALFNNENFELVQFRDGDILGVNKRLGKPVPEDTFTVHSKIAMITHMGVTKEGKPHVIIDITPDELLAFAKKAKKEEAYFVRLAKSKKHYSGSYLRHLNPEVTFCLEPPLNKRKPKKNVVK